MSSEDQIKFEQKKASLILDFMNDTFFEEISEELQSGKNKFTTIESLDAFVDKRLREFEAQKDVIRDFYNARIEAIESDNS